MEINGAMERRRSKKNKLKIGDGDHGCCCGCYFAAAKSAAGKELLRQKGMARGCPGLPLFFLFSPHFFLLCFLFNEGSSIDLANNER